MANILLTPLSYIGCISCLSQFKKDEVKRAYLKCWSKSHSDSKLKTDDENPKFMESFGYAFQNLVDEVQPLLNLSCNKNQNKKLDWQFIWNAIVGIETRIMADTLESDTLEKYIDVLDGLQSGNRGQKFPVGYVNALKSHLEVIKDKEEKCIKEASVMFETSKESEQSCLDVSTEIDIEDPNEVISINLDEAIDDWEINEKDNVASNHDNLTISKDCKRKVEPNLTNIKKKKTLNGSHVFVDQMLDECQDSFCDDEMLDECQDSFCDDEHEGMQNQSIVNSANIKRNVETDKLIREEVETLIDVNDSGDEKNFQSDVENDLDDEKNFYNGAEKVDQDELKKRSNFSWKSMRQSAIDKGAGIEVSEVDENTLSHGCFLLMNETVKHSEITNTRNWGRGKKLRWDISKSALGYNCQGSKICDNDECEYLRNAKFSKSVKTKRNVYYWSKLNGIEVCSYCESSKISVINCDAKLLIVTSMSKKTEVFQSGEHSCFMKRMTSKLPEDFKEQLKTNELTPRATEDLEILKMIKNGKSKDEIISKASLFISSGKHGSERKHSQITKELGSREQQIIDAQQRFSRLDHLIIEHLTFSSKEPKVFGTSKEMLDLALSIDSDLVEDSEEFVHQDGVHSYLREGKMLAIYSIHPLLQSIVRIAWVFCQSENFENIAFLWTNFNRVYSERKKEYLVKIKKDTGDLKFKPYGILTDCHGANSNGLIVAGYDQEWIMKALRNCLSHFKMRVEHREKEIIKSHGAVKAKEFQRLSWKWQGSVTEEGACSNYEEWKSLCDTVGLGQFCRWWNRQRMFIVNAFRGVYTPKSNLSECYQSGLSKGLSLVQAINNQGVASLRISVRLFALSKGSRNVKGQTPTKTEKRLTHEHSDALYGSKIADEVENIILVDGASCSTINNQPDFPPGDQQCGPINNGNQFGRKPNHRRKINKSAEKSLKFLKTFKWTVIAVSEKKIFKLRRGNMVVSVNISNYPSCSCSFWQKTNESSDQTCADIMFVLNEFFKVPIDDSRIYQVMFKTNELELLRCQYKAPLESTPEWGTLSDSELKELFQKESSEEPVWMLGRTKKITSAKCRGCSKKLGHNQVIIYVDGLSLHKKILKPIPNRFHFCVNSECPKKLPYTNLSAPETFKLLYMDGESVLSNEEITEALNLINIDLDE